MIDSVVREPQDKTTKSKSKAASSPKPAKNNKVKLARVIILIVVAITGTVGWLKFNQPQESNQVTVSGRIEGYETNVGAKIGGRVDFVAAREGDSVSKDQLLVKVADDDIQAQLRGAKARILKAEEQVLDSTYQLEVIKSQIEEAQLRFSQSKEETKAQISQAESNVAQAKARLSESKAALVQAKSELTLARAHQTRYANLVAQGAISLDDNDRARTAGDTAAAIADARESGVEAAEKEYIRTTGALEQAKSWRLTPAIRDAATSALKKQLIQAEYKLKTAEHEITSAKAERDSVQANINYLAIKSPITGVVTARSVEPGAVVTPGQNLLSVIDLNTVYLRGYVPEGQIGLVRVGQKAEIMLDSSKDKVLEGSVIQIDPEASFTPENIYFKEDRVKQVFGIKIAIKQPGGYAKPGMPADAKIVISEVPTESRVALKVVSNQR